jgi:hypothetical protein
MAKPNTPASKKNSTYKAAGVVILGLLIIAAVLFIFKSCSGDKLSDPTPSGGIAYDPSAVEGGWNEADTDEIVGALNKQVEEGYINISMNTSPVFANGTSTGNLMIVNEGVNRYPQIVEISRDDTGEVVYKSGAIPVGSKIEAAKLDVPLSAGTYACTAIFHNIDPDTGLSLGCAGAVISITVLE